MATTNNKNIIANSKIGAKLLAVLASIIEYVGDYLSPADKYTSYNNTKQR